MWKWLNVTVYTDLTISIGPTNRAASSHMPKRNLVAWHLLDILRRLRGALMARYLSTLRAVSVKILDVTATPTMKEWQSLYTLNLTNGFQDLHLNRQQIYFIELFNNSEKYNWLVSRENRPLQGSKLGYAWPCLLKRLSSISTREVIFWMADKFLVILIPNLPQWAKRNRFYESFKTPKFWTPKRSIFSWHASIMLA